MTDLQDPPGVQLQKRTPGDVVPVLDGELVADRPDRGGRPHLIGRIIRGRADVVTTLGSSSTVAVAGRGGMRAVRVAWTTAQGVESWAKRAHAAATFGTLREEIRLARLSGDRAAVREIEKQLTEARDARITRLTEAPRAVLGVLALLGLALGTLLVALLLLGVGAAATAGPEACPPPPPEPDAPACSPAGAGWAGWWGDVGAVLGTIFDVAQWLLQVGPLLALPVLAVAAWREGWRAAEPPMWLFTPEERLQAGSEITADTITQALAHVKIPALTRYLKEGGRLEFIVPPREQGGGTYFQVKLPLGVIAAELLPSAKVELLGGNLSRHRHETWPQRQPDADARVLDCWVADKGAMDRPAPPWPLLDEGLVNVFRDRFPWGVTMRGEPILVVVLQKHWLIGANSKQGKTTVVRTFLLFLALDPVVELKIADLKGDGDFRMLKARCSTYIEGQADEDAEAAVVMLEDVVAEMRRRYDEKARLGITGPITERLARQPGSGFHPMWVVVDECQVMYMAGKASDGSLLGGSKDEARAQAAAKRLHDQARAMLIHLVQATQRPDPQTMPVRVREGAHVRAAGYVPNLGAAKMILADAAERGARPHDLRPGRDAGTVVAAGEVEDIPAGQAFAIVRTHYVSTAQAGPVAERAIEAWRQRGGGRLRVVPPVDAQAPDHLPAVERAMRGEPKVRTTLVLARLIEDDAAVYDGWDHVRLAEVLRDAGCPPVKDSVMVLRLADVERAMRQRESARALQDGAERG